MTQEDIVLLLKKTFEDAVDKLRTQAEYATKLSEPGIADALTQTADCLAEVDVEFHVHMLDVYKDEAEDASV